MYGTDHDIPYLHIRNSAPQDGASKDRYGTARAARTAGEGMPLQPTVSHLCIRPQLGVASQQREKRVSGGCKARVRGVRASGRGKAKVGVPHGGNCGGLGPYESSRCVEHGGSCVRCMVRVPPGEDTIGEVQWSRHELIYSSSTRHTKKPEPCRAPTWRVSYALAGGSSMTVRTDAWRRSPGCTAG